MMARLTTAAATLWAAFALVIPFAASAQDGPNFEHFRKGAEVAVQNDRAYLLIHMPAESVSTKLQPVLLRKPGEAELTDYRRAKQEAYERAAAEDKDIGPIETFAFEYSKSTNLFQLENGKFYSRDGKDRTFVIAVEPDEYVFYGLGFNKYLWQCNCLGTVSFTATAGQITDMGSVLIALAWKESGFPELNDDTNLGKKMRQDYAMFAVGIRPATGGSAPSQLTSLPIAPAEYQAVGSFREPARLLANRVAPIPGVLTYEAGLVIDARTGEPVPKRF